MPLLETLIEIDGNRYMESADGKLWRLIEKGSMTPVGPVGVWATYVDKFLDGVPDWFWVPSLWDSRPYEHDGNMFVWAVEV